jgi:hypothetical protein
MTRLLIAGGSLAALVGLAVLVPAFVEWRQRGTLPGPGVAVVGLGAALILGGTAAVLAGRRGWRGRVMPAGVVAAVAVNTLFLALLALEISDGVVRRGAFHPVSSFSFSSALLLLAGLLSGRRWAWWTARGAAVLFTLWFLGLSVAVCFAEVRTEQGPVPWQARVWMVAVGLGLAGLLGGGFLALGRPPVRRHFGLEGPPGQE